MIRFRRYKGKNESLLAPYNFEEKTLNGCIFERDGAVQRTSSRTKASTVDHMIFGFRKCNRIASAKDQANFDEQ